MKRSGKDVSSQVQAKEPKPNAPVSMHPTIYIDPGEADNFHEVGSAKDAKDDLLKWRGCVPLQLVRMVDRDNGPSFL